MIASEGSHINRRSGFWGFLCLRFVLCPQYLWVSAYNTWYDYIWEGWVCIVT